MSTNRRPWWSLHWFTLLVGILCATGGMISQSELGALRYCSIPLLHEPRLESAGWPFYYCASRRFGGPLVYSRCRLVINVTVVSLVVAGAVYTTESTCRRIGVTSQVSLKGIFSLMVTAAVLCAIARQFVASEYGWSVWLMLWTFYRGRSEVFVVLAVPLAFFAFFDLFFRVLGRCVPPGR